jgi:hypothetical protein
MDDDVVEVVAFLASSGANNNTGTTIGEHGISRARFVLSNITKRRWR